MDLLQQYYKEIIVGNEVPKMPTWEDLTDEQKKYLEGTYGYAAFRLGVAGQELYNAIKIGLIREKE